MKKEKEKTGKSTAKRQKIDLLKTGEATNREKKVLATFIKQRKRGQNDNQNNLRGIPKNKRYKNTRLRNL